MIRLSLPLLILVSVGCNASGFGGSLGMGLAQSDRLAAGLRVTTCGALLSQDKTHGLPIGGGLDLRVRNSDRTVVFNAPSIDYAVVSGSDIHKSVLLASASVSWVVFRSERVEHWLSIGGGVAAIDFEGEPPSTEEENSDQIVLEYRVGSRQARTLGGDSVRWEFGVSAHLPIDGGFAVIIPSIALVFSK